MITVAPVLRYIQLNRLRQVLTLDIAYISKGNISNVPTIQDNISDILPIYWLNNPRYLEENLFQVTIPNYWSVVE